MKILPRKLHNSYMYNLNIKYHSAILYSKYLIFSDNFRFKRVLWDRNTLFEYKKNEYISYCYIEKDSMEFAIDNLLQNLQDTIEDTNNNEPVSSLEMSNVGYGDCIGSANPYIVVPVFEDADEHKKFIEYVKANKDEFLKELGDFSYEKNPDNKAQDKVVCTDYIDYLCKSGGILVNWLDKLRNKPEI